MIGRQIEQYEIIQKLGSGGMGEVFLAEDTSLGRRVAIKFLPSEFASDDTAVARFRREAHAVAALDHPNIVAIHAAGVFEGRPYLVMAYVEGSPLSSLILPGAIPAQRILAIARDVLDGLAFAHRAGVVHRDIKSSNLILGNDGRTRILDFGLAKLDGSRTLTETDTTMGTPHYMAPEQLSGGTSDARSDLYSFGVVLYEMLTGRLPFEGRQMQAVFYATLNEMPARPARAGDPVADELAEVAMRALAKNPSQRYASADAMRDALPSTAGAVTTAKSGNTRRVVVVAALIAAFVIAAGWYWRSRDGDAGSASTAGPARLIGALKLSQLTFDSGVEQWAAWSPDGKRIAYVGETGGFRKLFVREVENAEARPLTTGAQDDIQPAWSPDGKKIAFVRANLSSGRLSPGDAAGFHFEGGDIHEVNVASGETVRVVADAFNPSYSPDGDEIVFDATHAGPRRIWVTDARGRNPRQLTTDASEAVAHVGPRWSPDGKRVAYRRVEKTRADIEVVDAATGMSSRLTNDHFNDLDPAWSPDGRFIYFSSNRGGGLNVWRVPAAETASAMPQQVTTGAGDDVQPSVSADGRRLAFSVLALHADLWRMPLDPATGMRAGDPEVVVATTREDSRGAWSPDGQWIAFNSDRGGHMNLWLCPVANSGGQRQLTTGAGGDYQANWAPDGSAIAFFSSRAGNADVWMVSVADGTLQQLTEHAALDINPFFSPDGRRIAFQSDRGGRSELWVMNRDGSEERRVADVEASGHFMRWFDDNRRVLFASGEGPDRIMYAVDVESGALVVMPRFVSGAHLSFSPDQLRLLEVAGHKVLWIYSLDGTEKNSILEFDDPDVRIDFPMWSPDGAHALFDRVAPQGGDIWMLDGLY